MDLQTFIMQKKLDAPLINIVGDHATYHLKHNAPLTSDLDTLAKSASDWVGRSKKLVISVI